MEIMMSNREPKKSPKKESFPKVTLADKKSTPVKIVTAANVRPPHEKIAKKSGRSN
jgi:hypothetical protein